MSGFFEFLNRPLFTPAPRDFTTNEVSTQVSEVWAVYHSEKPQDVARVHSLFSSYFGAVMFCRTWEGFHDSLFSLDGYEENCYVNEAGESLTIRRMAIYE